MHEPSVVLKCFSFLIYVHLIIIESASVISPKNEIIRSDYQPYTGDGNGYSFQYETEDGQVRNEEGVFLTADDGQMILRVIGFYSYVDPSGKYYSIKYEADENGYRQTEQLPLSPSKNRIHPNAVKSLIG